jgi:P-type Ca2+ transporter type 2C
VQEVVVGDIALLEPGEIVPCDGIFLGGHNVRCDESSSTGESDAMKKADYRKCLALRHELAEKKIDTDEKGKGKGSVELPDGLEGTHADCFIVSGSKVLEGVGRYVVVAVGTKSFNGRIMMGGFFPSLSGWVLTLGDDSPA